MKKLLRLLVLVCTLLAGGLAHAQRPLGKPNAFKNCNALVIETTDDPAQATARLVQLLEANNYQVEMQKAGTIATRLLARQADAGPGGSQLIFQFMVTNDNELLRYDKRHGNTTVIRLTGYQRTPGQKIVTRISNEYSEAMSATWATEQRLAAAYPNPAATLWYDKDDSYSSGEMKLRTELSKSSF